MVDENGFRARVLASLERNDAQHQEIKNEIGKVCVLLIGNGGAGLCEKVRVLEGLHGKQAEAGRWRNRAMWGAIITILAKVTYDVFAAL